MWNWFFHPTGDFVVDTWTVIGTILLCIVFAALILIGINLAFSRVIRLIIGVGLRPVRLLIAGGIYVPLIAWWVHFVYIGSAGFKEWLTFIALLIFLNYIPVNIVGKILDHVASGRSRNKQKRLEEKAKILAEIARRKKEAASNRSLYD